MRIADLCLTLFAIVATAALTWPGMAIVGTRLEPRVLGLPPAFWWTVLWVLATFGALVLYHLKRGARS